MRTKTPTNMEQIRICKQLLYEGKPQERIAAIVGVSQATVSRIKGGKLHGDVPWPDGSIGALEQGNASPREAEWSADARRLLSYSSEVQERILHVVNERRGLIGLPPIPEIDYTYAAFLDGDETLREAYDLQRARDGEDTRLATIIREFDTIVQEQQSANRDEEIIEALASTRSREVGATSHEPSALAASSAEEARASYIPTYNALSWNDVVHKASRNKLVVDAIDNPVRMEAICIAFAATNEWGSEAVYRLADDAEEIIKRYPALVAQLEERFKGG